MAMRGQIMPVQFNAFVRDAHALGMSDRVIAEKWNEVSAPVVTRSCVRSHRVEMELKAWRHSTPALRQAVAKRLVRSRAVRLGNRRKKAICAGWPEDLRPREVDILDVIWRNGPMTKREIAAALGKKMIHSGVNCPDYFGSLQKLGLLVKITRAVQRSGKNRNLSVYLLPLDIRRRKITL
jgi:hypothetical protein